MKIITFTTPLLDQNMYIIQEDAHCIVIDPYFDENIAKILEDKIVDLLLVTHEHYDHISGVNRFKELFGCKLIANSKCNRNLQKPTKNFSKYFEAYYEFQADLKKPAFPFESNYACIADIIFEGNTCIEWRSNLIYLKEVPGHSEGGNFIFLNNKILFSGDLLIDESIPASKFPGGNSKDFKEIAIPYINSLSPDIIVYPGHGEKFVLENYFGYNKKE